MSQVNITVNGEQRSLPDHTSVSKLLELVNVDSGRKGIAVAVNDSVVRRPDWSDYQLGESDRVDIIQATQGG